MRAIVDEHLASGKLDFADRRDHGGSAAGKGLAQSAINGILTPLLEGIAFLAHGHVGGAAGANRRRTWRTSG